MLHFLLHALSQLYQALKVLFPLYWQFKPSFVLVPSFSVQKALSELHLGLTQSQLAAWDRVEGCSTLRRNTEV